MSAPLVRSMNEGEQRIADALRPLAATEQALIESLRVKPEIATAYAPLLVASLARQGFSIQHGFGED